MSTPVNLAAIEAKQALAIAGKMVAAQVMSKERFAESAEVAFNPTAVQNQQERLSRFRPLNQRLATQAAPKEEEKKIQEVQKKAEEDLSQRFGQQRHAELSEEHLKALREALKRSESPEELLERVTGLLEDPFLADEALSYLERESPGNATLREARALHQQRRGGEILSGRNIDPAVQEAKEKEIGKTNDLRSLYREVTTGQERSHNALFAQLAKQYGNSFEKMREAAEFLFRAMGYDLCSKGTSIERGELTRLLHEMRTLQSILWVYGFFQGRLPLMGKMFAKEGLTMPSVAFEELAAEFIRFVEEKYPGMAKLLQQVERFGLSERDLVAKIIFLSQYRDAMTQLSSRIYKSSKHRQDLLMVILEALEELEERYDEEEEEKERERERKALKKRKRKE